MALDAMPELIDLVALRLLDRHFAPGLHEAILAAVGPQLGAAAATERRRDAAFRAAVLEAYLAECRVCGFSLRLAEGLVGVDAANIRWHAHGGPDKVPNGPALCALHHRLFDHGALTVLEDLRLRVAAALSGSSARGLLEGINGRLVLGTGFGSHRDANQECLSVAARVPSQIVLELGTAVSPAG